MIILPQGRLGTLVKLRFAYAIVFLVTAFSSSEEWLATLGDVGGASAVSGIPAKGNGVVIACNNSSGGALVMEIDSNGQRTWNTVVDPGFSASLLFRSIAKTRDGGYLLVGTKTDAVIRRDDTQIVKIDSAGQVVWQRSYPRNGWDNAGYDVRESQDGTCVVSCGSWAGSEGRLLYLSSSGTPLHDKAGYLGYSCSQSDLLVSSTFLAVRPHSQNGVFLLANGDVDGECGMILYRADSSGHLMWERSHAGLGAVVGRSMEISSGGGLICVGGTQRSGLQNIYLLKTDRSGMRVWENVYESPFDQVAQSLALTPDGGCIMAGYTRHSLSGQENVYILRVDRWGRPKWSRMIEGTGRDFGYDITSGPDKAYYLMGSTSSAGTSNTFKGFVQRLEEPPVRLSILPSSDQLFAGDTVEFHLEIANLCREPLHRAVLAATFTKPDGSTYPDGYSPLEYDFSGAFAFGPQLLGQLQNGNAPARKVLQRIPLSTNPGVYTFHVYLHTPTTGTTVHREKCFRVYENHDCRRDN